MKRRLSVALTAVFLLAATVAPVGAATAEAPAGEKLFTKGGNYLVRLAELPVVAYDGNVKGYKATKPTRGSKIDPNGADVVKYAGYLKSRHDAILRAVGATKKLYDYAYSYNGFAAKLTARQANKLAVMKGVESVSPEELRHVDTSSTPTFLGLDAPGGLWSQLGGTGSAGDRVIIGIIDSGIWPESKSFSDRNAAGKLIYGPVPGFHGKCASADTSEAWDANLCNKKLVAAQYFNASWGGNAGIEATRPWEFTSPRDYNGHGTHTASTSGGNNAVAATGDSALFGSVSGIAPHARIAAYKALWSNEDASSASGLTGDLVAAIDRAVADGVDVINYSISGTLTNYADPVEISFLFAAAAGIFVSESAGNSGPTISTVAHPAPWTTTVAAGTHNRSGNGSVTLGNGATYNGRSLTPGVGPVAIVNATASGIAGADPNLVRQCFSSDPDGDPVLDPALVTGKIVVCERGGAAPANARVDKSAAVKAAGGVGVVIYNVAAGASLNADLHTIPAVHIDNVAGGAVASYAAGAGATATIAEAVVVLTEPAPFTAGFSSRGPSLAGGGDVLKPDLIAPGQDILAAVAPPGNAGRDFNILSGTSMSAPHVAGLAALLMDRHPSWSPAAIKSALMTSAGDVLDGANTNQAIIFRQGAGHVRPNLAANPGLVFDAGMTDWRAFLRSQGVCTFCFGTSPAPLIDPSDFNSPSIAIGALAGVQTVTRRVTNVGGSAATYTPTVTGMSGITTVVSPATLNIAAGATATFTVQFTTAGATLNAYTGGQLTWSDGTHSVRIPLVVKPVALAAPAEVSGTGADINYNVTFGYNGPFSAIPRGLVPATVTPGVVQQDPDQAFNPADSTGTTAIPVAVPAGTSYARFQLFDADVDPGSDIDLYVYRGTTLVGASGGGSSDEIVNLVNPVDGAYTVYVHGWGVADGVDTPFTLYHWLLDTTDAGNMTVTAPATAVLGATGTVTLSFWGLSGATRYLGSVAYSGTTGMPNPTIVRVTTP